LLAFAQLGDSHTIGRRIEDGLDGLFHGTASRRLYVMTQGLRNRVL
jgi:hypothetical protein